MKQHSFFVVPGSAVEAILSGGEAGTIGIVEETYKAHESGLTNNPDSYFLRFEDKPEARIIALPAAIRSDLEVSGIKWIASYPKNVEVNMQRASAVMILNDYQSGYPLACLEASQISSARTAASAALGAKAAVSDISSIRQIAFVGAGLIARTTLTYLIAAGFRPDRVNVYDRDPDSARNFAAYARSNFDCEATVSTDIETALSNGDVVTLATTAAEPYIHDPRLFRPGQVILNVSLRDLAPEIILSAFNFFDDVEHCMKANTSPHLTEQREGNRDFAHATLGELLLGTKTADQEKPIIFSPFGLGILDLAVAHHVLEQAKNMGTAVEVPDFLPSMVRW